MESFIVNNKTFFKRGFTLIEILVASAVLGLAVMVASKAFIDVQKSTKRANQDLDLTSYAVIVSKVLSFQESCDRGIKGQEVLLNGTKINGAEIQYPTVADTILKVGLEPVSGVKIKSTAISISPLVVADNLYLATIEAEFERSVAGVASPTITRSFRVPVVVTSSGTKQVVSSCSLTDAVLDPSPFVAATCPPGEVVIGIKADRTVDCKNVSTGPTPGGPVPYRISLKFIGPSTCAGGRACQGCAPYTVASIDGHSITGGSKYNCASGYTAEVVSVTSNQPRVSVPVSGSSVGAILLSGNSCIYHSTLAYYPVYMVINCKPPVTP